MSDLIVKVVTIDAVKPHTNADALELAEIGGWQVVIPKGQYKAGDKVVYFPPDVVLPGYVSDSFGVTKYLSNYRIRCAKLRGEPSFGLVTSVPHDDWEDGLDVASYYAATKYMPPVRPTVGNALPQHPLFPRYTDIQNLRHFPNAFDGVDSVYVTEKIHGTNCRVGMVDGIPMAGSMNVRRDLPTHTEGVEPTYSNDTYWLPHGMPEVKALFAHLSQSYKQVILFGEIYGSGIQTFTYGLNKQGERHFRAFDLLLDGKYADSDFFFGILSKFNVPLVPLLYAGVFDFEKIKAFAQGKSVIGGDHIREGVVIKPQKEMSHVQVGRLALKYVSDNYLLGNHSDFTEA